MPIWGTRKKRAAPSRGADVIGFIQRNPELVACLRPRHFGQIKSATALHDSIVQLSGTLNCRLQANHLLRRYFDLVWTPLNTMILVCGPHRSVAVHRSEDGENPRRCS